MILVATFCLVLATYLLLVKTLRYQRLRDAQTRFHRLKAENLLDPSAAQEIAHTALLYDMPFFSRLGAQIALFKTYGIPTIAALLLKTGELTDDNFMSKRVTDTAILISSFIMCPLTGKHRTTDGNKADPRGCLAIARMNWLHQRYRISNNDMLYTLSRFILQPMDLVAILDWRPYSPEEKESVFLLWKEIGQRMDIKDIPETLEDLENWSKEYEEQHMIASESNHRLAKLAIEHMKRRVPNFPGLRSFVSNAFISVLDERLRTAMMLPAPRRWVKGIIWIVFGLRSIFIKHLSLPRRGPRGYIALHDPPTNRGSNGRLRLYTLIRQHYPWYYPDTAQTSSLLTRFKQAVFGHGGHIPGPEFKSEGYRIEELGPLRFEDDGHAEVFVNAEAMYGSPISAPWAPH